MNCSFCSATGHYKTTCSLRQSIKIVYNKVNRNFLNRLGANMNRLGLRSGAIMKSRLRGDGLYLFNEFSPENINIGNLYQPTRSKRLSLPHKQAFQQSPFSVKRITAASPEMMYMDMPMTFPTEYLQYPECKSAIRPEGWLRHVTLTFDGPGVYTPPFSDDYGADTYELVDSPLETEDMIEVLLTSDKESDGFADLEKYFHDIATRKSYATGAYLLEALMRYIWILDDDNSYEAEYFMEQSALNHVRKLRRARDWVHTVDGQTVLHWHSINGSNKAMSYDKGSTG